MAEIPDTIHEEREEIMVSATGDANPTLRIAHFLKPSSITASVKNLPPLPPSFKPTSSDLKKLLHRVKFKGWRCPIKSWNSWVQHLHPTYHSTWKEVGIYDAIMSTTYQILRHTELIVGVAENWCCETNTFIFPWGEATITLEDVMVLGGYSALGESVLSPLETGELKETEERLLEACKKIYSLTEQVPRMTTWIDHFITRKECEFEHEAFLSLWLSRYVFRYKYDKIVKSLFPLAILLARGTRVALAPAILASIYRDLGLLNKKIVDSNKVGTGGDNDDSSLRLFAPFHLVQLWVWERFPSLRPKPNSIKAGEPRLARWHKLSKVQVENVRLTIDTEGKCFQWRPYAINNWSIPKFYRENEEWVLVDSDLDKELESIARCIRVSELVGIDCIEQYLPHRVAMQFGLDQDVPGCVFRSNETPEIAWSNYNRPIRDAKLYIPGRLSEPDVTTLYFKWWRQLLLVQQDAISGVVRKPRSLPRLKQNVKRHKKAEDSVNEDRLTIKELSQSTDKKHSTGSRPVGDVSHLLNSHYRTLSFCNKRSVMNKEEKVPMKAIEKNMQGDDIVKESEEAMEDIHRVEELLQLLQLTENTPIGDVNQLLDSEFRTSSCNMSTAMTKEAMLPTNSLEKTLQSEALMKETEEAVEEIKENDLDVPVRDTMSQSHDNEVSSSYSMDEIPGLELEARLNKLQEVIAGLKAAYRSKFEKVTMNQD